ncbi:cytochrome d ubiquinol oxidase subunit II [Curvivirga sp.]|uniref:cytochrome d ubiquinol oxidase subunit II n=1 Tax=Curvivirga sp. TaxID=2856848 RepID=UPI003B5A3D1C
MLENVIQDGSWLPLTFAFLMGLSMLIYAILDGYDLGVGILIHSATQEEKDRMIASIGPFWDANETWLILGVGLLLVAFPAAHGIILTELYIPVAVMIFGLIFRGVAFDFRAKVPQKQKGRWNRNFFYGSLLTALAQGYMLGSYIIGFDQGLGGILFSCLIALAVTSAYCLIGACWLIMKTEGDLQLKAIRWAKLHLIASIIGLTTVSITTPLVSNRIYEKWFDFPTLFALAPIPIATGILILCLFLFLRILPLANDRYCWVPILFTVGIFTLSFIGLAYSFFPYIVPEKMTIVEAAAAPDSLMIMLFGALIVLPILLGYTALSYYIFHGKATELRYD